MPERKCFFPVMDAILFARTGNWFLETNLVIARLDKLSRNEDVQQKLQTPDFGVTSVNYDFAELLARAKEPA